MDIWANRKRLKNAQAQWEKAFNANKESVFLSDPDADDPLTKTIDKEQRALGIVGGGLLTLSRARSKPVLLYAPTIQKLLGINEDVHSIETLYTKYPHDDHKLIDLLFLVSREASLPEFIGLINAPRKNRFEYLFEKKLRKEYLILHCSAGEIMAFCLYWRMLAGIIHHVSADESVLSALDHIDGKSKKVTLETLKDAFASCQPESSLIGFLGVLSNKKFSEPVEVEAVKAIRASTKKVYEHLDFNYLSNTKGILDQLGITKKNNWALFSKYATEILGFNGIVPNAAASVKDWSDFGRQYFHAFSLTVLKVTKSGKLKLALKRLHDTARFPVIPYSYILQFDVDNEPKEHLAFPIWHSFNALTHYAYEEAGRPNIERALLFSLYTIKIPANRVACSNDLIEDPSSNSWTEYQDWLGGIISNLSSLVNPYVDRSFYADEHKKNIEIIEDNARAAAISQVLARTLSHNLGSHSLNAFSGEEAMLRQFEIIETHLTKGTPLPGRVQSGVQSKAPVVDIDKANAERVELTPLENAEKSIVELQKHVENAEKLSVGRRKLIATYNNYLRERMDLLADITTAVPAFEMPKQLVEDLLKGYANNVLLATTIAGTGGRFKYFWQPVITVGDGKQKDVTVAIPSDTLGAHSFYLILENIVRNSAKHGGHSKEVVFTVKVEEVTKEEWKSKGLVKVSITERCTAAGKRAGIAEERNCWIDKSVLDKTTRRVREKAWGTLEMKAACAYLRRIPLEDLDQDKYKTNSGGKKGPPLLRAVGDGDGFGYEFYMQRPKLVMVCGEQGSEAEVIKSAFKEGTTPEQLVDKGIGTMTLKELMELKDGPVNHALLVFMAESVKGLKEFIRVALKDLAALPHEMVVVRSGKAMKDCHLEAVIDEVVKELSKAKVLSQEKELSQEGIAHNATILKRSVGCMGREVWEGVSEDLSRLFMELRHEWLVGWMRFNECSLNTVPDVYADYLKLKLKPELTKSKFKFAVDYDPHVELQGALANFLDMTPLELESKPADLSDFILRQRNGGAAQHVIIQRYPDSLSRVMTLGWKKGKDQHNARIKAEDRQTWAQHHLASWTKGVAVIDERIQGIAEYDTYQPEATETIPSPQPIRVKHQLSTGGVFVPPMGRFNLQRSDAFTLELWDQLVDEWLSPLHPLLGYVCIHLTLLEKFNATMECGLDKLIGKLKSALPGVRVIVVSGRGKPPELPRTELFMSYSALAQYTTQTYQRAPVLLNILSHSTRRIITS